MGETITIKQAIEIVVNHLGNIRVRTADIDTVGMQIRAAIGNLNAVIEAIDKGGEAHENNTVCEEPGSQTD